MFIGGLLYQAVLPRDHCKTLLEKLKSANKSVLGGGGRCLSLEFFKISPRKSLKLHFRDSR
jgi:hypothetical protein